VSGTLEGEKGTGNRERGERRLTRRIRLTISALLVTAGCGETPCPRCDTIVVAATGEPRSLLPPVVVETVGRDISDQIYERLADLTPGAASIDTAAYRPRLASAWERIDSVTLRFHLRPGARWQDGEPVTAADVVFSFEAFSDSVIDAQARPTLAGSVTALAEDSNTVLIKFRRAYAEQLYDATWHVRVIPAHIWKWIARDSWAADTAVSRVIGSGPYRLTRWDRAQSVTLERDITAGRRAKTGRAIWRFATDPEAALNLVLAGEADLLESVGTPERIARVAADSGLGLVRYPAATYGFLGYQLAPRGPGRSVALADRGVRRALNMAVDRAAIATLVYGAGTRAPPGPMSQLLWIWDDSVTVLPFDTAAAARAFDEAGWPRGRDGMRRRAGRPLRFDILVPSTSLGRKRLAEALQEQWRQAGVEVAITAVDFPIFLERLGQGGFDSYIGSWLDEPSPRGLAEQWTTAGIGAINYGHYSNAAFDRRFGEAVEAHDVATARRRWREAMDTLNADAAALFLYAPVNVAAVSRRVEGLTIDPYSWLSGLPSLTVRPK
jgi:peptide/nickel transport system substrate-binding protein